MVIDMGEGCSNEATEELLTASLRKDQCDRVEAASMDMSQTYIGAVKKCLPHRHICFDKFHLVNYLNEP